MSKLLHRKSRCASISLAVVSFDCADEQCHWPAENEVHRNKKRKHPRPLSITSDLPSGYTISDIHPQTDHPTLLSLAELPSPYTSTNGTPAGKATYESPTNETPTTSITSLQPAWSFAQIPSIHTSPLLSKNSQIESRRSPGQRRKDYMDASEFSDILIAPDKQAELMADA